MNFEIKTFFRNAVIYSLGMIAERALAFFLIPLYTRQLSTDDFGLLSIVRTFTECLRPVILLGLPVAIKRSYLQKDINNEKRKVLLGTCLIWSLIYSFVMNSGIIVFSHKLSMTFFKRADFANLFCLISITLFLSKFNYLYYAILQAKQESKKYILISLSYLVLSCILNLYLLIVLKLNVKGILFSNLIASFIIVIPAILFFLKNSKFVFDFQVIKNLLGFGLLIVPVSYATWILDLSDRYFLIHYTNLTEIGYYEIGYKIGMLLNLIVVMPFQIAWPVYYFSKGKNQDFCQQYKRIFDLLIITLLIVWLGLALFSKPILTILAPPQYLKSNQVIALVALAYVFNGIQIFFHCGIHLSGKSKYLTFIIIFSALINIILNYLFIPRYGILGAAWSTVFSFGIMVLLTYLVSQRYFKYKIHLQKLIYNILILGMIYILFQLFIHNSSVLTLALKLLAFSSFSLICFRIYKINIISLYSQKVQLLLHTISKEQI